MSQRHLSDVAVGSSARVTAIEGSDEISIRLMEMGLVPGAEVKTLGAAPLGDPLEYSLRGYRLSLRRAEAERIQVSE